MADSGDAPHTLTQMLRSWDDSALSELLLSRPDLALPSPTDLTQVASRATTRHSVSAALDGLNAFELEVARRASALPAGSTPTDLAENADVDEAAVLRALHRLQRLALMWGDDSSLRPVRAFSALLGGAESMPLPSPHPPLLGEAPRQPSALVDKVAAGSAFEFARRVEVLGEHCDHQPVRLRHAGGVASREMKTLAALLDVPTAMAAAHLEIAEAAGLLGPAAQGAQEILLPTTEFDSWQGLALADQWAELAASWFDRHPASGPSWLKRLCLQAYGSPADGRVLSVADLRAWVAWHRPRRPPATERQVTTLLEQASWIGVTGLGALSSFALELDVTILQAYLPARSGHVLVQADLTAIAPGPLTAEAAREMGAFADVESRGGATVYRFTADSLARALRLGWEPPEILAALQARSRTELPQPLRYLVQDLARRRAEAGVGYPAGDASPSPAPAATASGHRTPPRATPRRPSVEQEPAAHRLRAEAAAALVAQLRSADAVTPHHRQRGGPAAPSLVKSPIDVLREAVETGEVVWLSLVDSRGTPGERLVRAVDLADGDLHALDARGDQGITVPVRRISAAHILRRGG